LRGTLQILRGPSPSIELPLICLRWLAGAAAYVRGSETYRAKEANCEACNMSYVLVVDHGGNAAGVFYVSRGLRASASTSTPAGSDDA
jgi:hypothetical protein